MSRIKISVEVENILLQTDGLTKDVFHTQYRLISYVVFVNKNKHSLSKPYGGIIDTGAPISVIPHSIWKNIHVRKFAKRHLSGINPEKQCKILCDVGIVLMQFVDKTNNRSLMFPCLAYLVPAQYDSVPLIFGIDRCLENFRLEIKFSTQKAYLIHPPSD